MLENACQKDLRVTGATGTLWLAKGSWPVGQVNPPGRAGNRARCGSAAAPGEEKWGKKKAGIQRTRLIVNQLRSSHPGLAVVYLGPQSGSVGTVGVFIRRF